MEQTYSQIVKFDLASNGYYGLVYSNDNGKTLHLLVGADGRLFEQKDGDRIWPFLVDKVKSVISVSWSEILNKSDVATQEDLKNIELKPGPQGPQGLPGKDGVTPHIDSTTGNWFIGNQDTGTQAQGPAGKNGRDGVDGQPGKDGQNGITPHIDTATGNWFVGSTDTGIKAQGPQGIQGVPGKDGQNGQNGSDGKPGVNGKDGINGKDGKSAYQIAIDHGFVGSESEWLESLHGKDGATTSDGDASLSIEAITDLVKQHIHALVDTNNGQLTISTDDVSNGSIADAVATKVVSSMSWKMDANGELIAEVGGE